MLVMIHWPILTEGKVLRGKRVKISVVEFLQEGKILPRNMKINNMEIFSVDVQYLFVLKFSLKCNMLESDVLCKIISAERRYNQKPPMLTLIGVFLFRAIRDKILVTEPKQNLEKN